MPAQFSILTEIPLVHVVFSGQITLEDMRALWREVYTSPEFKPGMNEVVDCSTVTDFAMGFDDMLEFAKTSQEIHSGFGVQIKLCVIAPDKMTTSFADMFVDLAQAVGYGNEVMVVEGYPEVFAVLDLSDEDIAHFPEPCREEAHLL